MTVRQLQLLLSYLGYSPGEIDGVAGEKTKAPWRHSSEQRAWRQMGKRG